MSITGRNDEWLSFVDISGPFVSSTVLQKVFPQGLEGRDSAQAKALRIAYEEWQDNPAAPGKQHAWIMHVLTAVLKYPVEQIVEGQTLPAGLEANVPEMGEILRPNFALVGPAGTDTAGQAQLLIVVYPAEQRLDKPVIGKHWKAAPTTRMMALLHGANVPLGLVTNGERWMLVYASRGETTGYATWYAGLWLDEPVTLRAFHSLLGVRRFFGVAADSTLLSLLKESANDQQEVTDQLGYQVCEAVEVLVQSFDALDKESNRALLNGVKPTTLYDSALTVMMRLVFLFSAEERGLLHLGKPLYDDNYAVSTLQEQLQEMADKYGEEVLERRIDAWVRLLATFRAVHSGIQHQDMLMQSYGGSLFDPDRYPFFEGRPVGSSWRSTPAAPLSVNNRVVLHLLNSLQRLRTKVGAAGMAETRRVSFLALGVEQIGHVYEGLLDHTAFRANEVILGIRSTRSKEPKIPLATLESLLAQGEDKLIEYLKGETGRSVSALRRELNVGSFLDVHKLLIAGAQDENLLNRLRLFSGLIGKDSFDRPLVVLPGSVFVTAGTTRRSTGTHYTPPSLTEPIVRYTLEPLVYAGPSEGTPREQWKLKSPKEILDLKICDMAMGSGAFLVQTCRYLAERLVEAWENEEKQHPDQVLISPDGKFSEGSPSERLVPAEAAERIAIARRVVADRCLYGVDINPMAVEMAKLSLWLLTVDANRPFTFLDHAFKCGDSLLGITSLEQLENFSLRPGGGKQQVFATLNLRQHIDDAKKKREMLELMPSDTPEQISAKAALYAEAEEAVAKLNAAADILVTVELKGLKGRAYESEREASVDHMTAHWAKGLNELQMYAHQRLKGRLCFHWALAYPEIIDQGGFDAFIGNPPFVGGRRIRESLGDAYRDILYQAYPNSSGNADLSAFFFRRAFNTLNVEGCFGLIATNTIAQGDTRETGLQQILDSDGMIYRAYRDRMWPGTAAVAICNVFVRRTLSALMQPVLDDEIAQTINSYLADDNSGHQPFQLGSNQGMSFQGSVVVGEGFILSQDEAESIIDTDKRNSDVICPYINGEDVNLRPDVSPSRYAINFYDWDIDKARSYPQPFAIIEQKVRPVREKVRREAHRKYWWHYGDKRPALYRAVRSMNNVLVCVAISKYLNFVFVNNGYIYNQRLFVFAFEDSGHFSCLQSSLHECWARTYASTLESRLSYVSSSCFDTFPFPQDVSVVRSVGEKVHEYRRSMAEQRQEGLTKIYNRFHEPHESDADIAELRFLHVEMDQAVTAAYGWQDIDLGHGFHETKQGVRFTISEAARREVLDRLLALNHKRHAEEESAQASQAATTPGKRGRKKPARSSNPTRSLFD
jgi:hypothetical protein